jgi:integrase
MDPAVANDPEMDPTVSSFETVIPRAKGQLWIGQASEDGNWSKMERIAGIIGPKTKLDHVDTKMIDKVIRTLAKDMADGTVNRYLSALSKFLKWAKTRKYRTVPVDDLEFAWRKEATHRIRWITEDEEAQLEDVLPPKTWKLVKLAIETGCRRGELLSIEPGQINGNRLHLWKTKTDSPRTIPMSVDTVKLATDLAGGEMPTANMLRRHWEIARGKLRLNHDDLFVFHTTRHTCATRLVDAGVNPFVIQEWMGHKNMETTLRYAHVRPENLDAALAKVGLFRAAANENSQNTAGYEGAPLGPTGVAKRSISAKR